jgi:hypothetical protein
VTPVDHVAAAEPVQYGGEMRRRRPLQTFEPVLIEKRGERRLTERRFP